MGPRKIESKKGTERCRNQLREIRLLEQMLYLIAQVKQKNEGNGRGGERDGKKRECETPTKRE